MFGAGYSFLNILFENQLIAREVLGRPHRGGRGPKIGLFCGQTVLRKCRQWGEGVKKPENFADVLYEWSLVR